MVSTDSPYVRVDIFIQGVLSFTALSPSSVDLVDRPHVVIGNLASYFFLGVWRLIR